MEKKDIKIGGIYKDISEGPNDHFRVDEVKNNTVHIVTPEGAGMYGLEDFLKYLEKGEILFLE